MKKMCLVVMLAFFIPNVTAHAASPKSVPSKPPIVKNESPKPKKKKQHKRQRDIYDPFFFFPRLFGIIT